MDMLTPRQTAALPYVKAWLIAVAVLIFCMVIVGGATRLTESGLSITEWQPLLGAIPPLTEADWRIAFNKYKLIPQYGALNQGMSLADFKFIFWWEWSHRLLGRFLAIAFFVPFAALALTHRIPRAVWPRLIAIFMLGGLQGALGWYMVASGLVDRVEVSQYRLTAHLVFATLIYGAILWVAMGLGRDRRGIPAGRRQWMALLIVALLLAQIAAGGFVAGLRAGLAYNSWPLMDGQLVPAGLFAMEPAWKNIFENAMTVQFDHRLLAYASAILIAAFAYVVRSVASAFLLGAVVAQIALGIATMLGHVPLALALVHQGGALVVFAAALWNLSLLLRRSPAPDRR